MVALYQAACNGYATRAACVELGNMYRDGDGVPRDVDSARSLYAWACVAGFLPGCRAARAITGAAPPGDPDDPVSEDGYIMTVRMVVHPSLPAVRLRLFGDDYGAVFRIDVFDEGKRAVVARLLDPREANLRGARLGGGLPIVRFADLNFDGSQDIMLLDWAGATGNKGYVVWLFDPGSRRFVFSHELTGPSNVEPHPEDRTLTTFATGGAAGTICDGERYRWVDNRPVLVRQVSQDWDDKTKAYVRVIREPEQGRLVIVRREARCSDGKLTVERFRGGRLLGVDTSQEELAEKPSCWYP